MRTIDSRLRQLLGAAPNSYWDEKIKSKPGPYGERILSQLVFASELSKGNAHAFDEAITATLDYVERQIAEEGVIAKRTALQAEQLLTAVAPAAKSYDILCVAHAHIDMNWMWPWDETVSVTLDTFRTMLTLMEEYPSFVFSQSQASVYRIVQQYDPLMLEEIKRRVREGRWEVTASHWVEADKNMPNGESLTRQILYTKRYLSQLLGIDPASLNLDFEPDTFGHSVFVPEILTNAGVRYYYHCRGSDGPIAYRWVAPSGNSVVCYREPTWYNDPIQPILGSYVPQICRQTGLKTHLHVYGVGDHGGGPTRRDLERLHAMNDWPIFPNIRFGRFADYYKQLESVSGTLPVVKGEQNCVFTGCYTSQSRIKTANRIGEATLQEAELFSAAAGALAGAAYPRAAYEEAWRNVLFNQFHDILPGSGVIETREHALGLFQHTMAIANTNRKLALERIAAGIDTSDLGGPDEAGTVSEGAGVGYGTQAFQITQVERGQGSTRIVHLFNPSAQNREEPVEIVLWDWNYAIRTLIVKDSDGNETAYQMLDKGFHTYWGHHYMRLLIEAKVPACGYSTYTVSLGEEEFEPFFPTDPRVDREERFVLENELLQVTFHPVFATVISMIDKTTGTELIDTARPAGLFRLIQEDPGKGMTAWWVGRYMSAASVHDQVKLVKGQRGPLRQSLNYELRFGNSAMKVAVSLDRNSPYLKYRIECDWQEIGKKGKSIPQLNFHWPLGYTSPSYTYDVPFGTVEREPLGMDVPGNSYAFGKREEKEEGGNKPSIMLVTNNKYGFRGTDDSLAVSLIRSSFDPDPYPELGNHHKIEMAVCVIGSHSTNRELTEAAYRFNHPLNVLSGTTHPGTRTKDASFLRLIEGSVALSAVKMPENPEGKRWIVRVYETDGQAAIAKLQLFKPATDAWYVDSNEIRLQTGLFIRVDGEYVCFEVPAYSAAAVCIVFE
ncbi:glycoside hydrolase family 38 C-terminal domain-containing protein [Paenibacillus ginsengarvi]|nr:alpha-mannosidase [Paenibacillus ginsengarvi]